MNQQLQGDRRSAAILANALQRAGIFRQSKVVFLPFFYFQRQRGFHGRRHRGAIGKRSLIGTNKIDGFSFILPNFNNGVRGIIQFHWFGINEGFKAIWCIHAANFVFLFQSRNRGFGTKNGDSGFFKLDTGFFARRKFGDTFVIDA